MSFFEDTSFPGASRLFAAEGSRKPSCCFRTTADGRIALTTDWMDLLTAARSLGPVAIQTRHAYARLVAFRDVPEFALCPEDEYAQASDGSLRVYFRDWHQAWGRLAECDCCGTPGRLEVHNRYALEFFQLCPLPGCEPAAWGDFLAAMATGEVRSPATTAARQPPAAFPNLPPDSRLLSNHAEDIVPWLIALGDEGVPLRCSLRTSEAMHSRGFATTHVDVTGGVLTAGEKGARFQIGMAAVRALVLSMSGRCWTLHFTGAGDTSLLALMAPAESAARESWRAALCSAFPQLRHF